MKRLRSQTSREIGERPMTTTKTEAWNLLRQESQLYIAEDNKVADGSADSIIYVEDNKERDGSGQTKGVDYMHSYMKQGLGGS
jgi:hypothetical protein